MNNKEAREAVVPPSTLVDRTHTSSMMTSSVIHEHEEPSSLRNAILQWLIGKSPDKGFETIVKLYIMCSTKRKQCGRQDWNAKEKAFLQHIQSMFVMTEDHAGARMFMEEAVESLLCVLYTLIE